MADSSFPIFLFYFVFFYFFIFVPQQNFWYENAARLERQRAINEKGNISWEEYKLAYGKTYANDADEKLHRDAFLSNKAKIQEHNAAFARGESNFRLGFSNLTDWTAEERQALSDYRPNKAAVGATKAMAKLRAMRATNAALKRRQSLGNELKGISRNGGE